MGMADRTRRKQCKQCAQGGLLGIAECIFGLLCAAGWLWLGARTIRAARCILACQQFGSACFHAAGLWQGVLKGYSGDELVYNKTLGDWRTHNGIDYACAKDAAVQSPTAGTVVLAGSDGSWGPTVAIKDSAGRVWRLCGVASPAVKEGETVSAGQTLGKVGSVSCECAEESHIHLEVKQDDSYLDPAKLMQ
mgnify:CR=1 FL=1